MPINFDGSVKDNFNVFGVALDKIYFQNGKGKPDTLVWENWKPASKNMSLGDAKQGETMYATLSSLNGSFKPTKVNWRYAWAGEGSHPANIKITMWDTNGNSYVLLNAGGYHRDTDYSFNVPSYRQVPINKIEIEAHLGGTVGVSKWFVSASVNGYQKGSSSRAMPMMMAAPQTLEEPTQEKPKEEVKKVVIKL